MNALPQLIKFHVFKPRKEIIYTLGYTIKPSEIMDAIERFSNYLKFDSSAYNMTYRGTNEMGVYEVVPPYLSYSETGEIRNKSYEKFDYDTFMNNIKLGDKYK